MAYPEAAWERAMTIREVMLKALSGELHGFRAAEILGWSPRTLRRWRERYEVHGYSGLVEKRLHWPSIHRLPAGQVAHVLRLYRDRYAGFNVRHFHDIARREHGVTVSYSFVKQALQTAGFVKTHRARGRHRRRREPRACFGELLHLDGSPHEWLARVPDWRTSLITVVDDATKALLYAQLWPQETTQAVMSALAHVLRTEGLCRWRSTPIVRAGRSTPRRRAGPSIRAASPRSAGRCGSSASSTFRPTHYSPHSRGRSERMNRTLQGWLVNELRVAGAATLAAANAYLQDVYLPRHNETFRRPPRDPANAFVPLGRVDLDPILCEEQERVIAPDNTVTIDKHVFQIERQPGRRTCAGLRVLVRQPLDGTITILRPPAIVLGRFTADGHPVHTKRGLTRSPQKPDRPGSSLRATA